MFLIRPSREDDIFKITEIYGYYVSHTVYTLEITPPSVDEMKSRRVDVLSKNLPYLVAEQSNQLIGYAYCNSFKPRPGYRFSAEVSIYVDKNTCGQGVGRLLLNALMHEAELIGIRKLISIIGDLTNQKSIRLHQSAGFNHVGLSKSLGWKFNQWVDVLIMEKSIGKGDTTPPE